MSRTEAKGAALLMHDNPMRDELHDNLLLAFSAIKEVKKDIKYGAENRPDSTDIAKNRVWYVQHYYQKCACFFYSGLGVFPITPFRWTKIKASSAKFYQAGNCGEQSSMAFCFLHEKKARNIELVHIHNGDHAFVVLGRKADSNISDYTTWGDNAVVCDPWGHRYYPANDLRFQLNDLLAEAGHGGFNPTSQTIVRDCLSPKIEDTSPENVRLADNLMLNTEDTQKLYAQFIYFLTLKKRYAYFSYTSNLLYQISLMTGVVGMASCVANFLHQRPYFRHTPRIPKTASIMMFTTAVTADGMKRMLGTLQSNNLDEQHNLWRKKQSWFASAIPHLCINPITNNSLLVSQ